ncbi:MAG: hypothetical protein AAF414_04370 [Pseudomonadota bacterium]
MARMTLEKAFSVDRKRGLLQMCADGEPLAHMIFDGAFLEQEIRDLARFRTNLIEPVADELSDDLDLEIQRSPKWEVPAAHSGPKGNVLMVLRHEGYGWTGYMLDREAAKELGAALIDATNADPKKKTKR